MPDRSVKMKRRIFGFQRRVWWPKWTPASSSSRMETTAIGLPFGWFWAVLPVGLGAHRPQGPAPRPGMVRRGEGTGFPESLAGTPRKPRFPALEICNLSACGRQRALELGRQRRGDVDRLARDRMPEGEPRRMEELALEPELAAAAGERVARDREVDRLEMHADLVRPPRLERDSQERVTPEQLLDLEVRHRLAQRVAVERVPQGVAPVATDRCVDRAAPRARTPDHEREILARQLARLNLLLQKAVSLR